MIFKQTTHSILWIPAYAGMTSKRDNSGII